MNKILTAIFFSLLAAGAGAQQPSRAPTTDTAQVTQPTNTDAKIKKKSVQGTPKCSKSSKQHGKCTTSKKKKSTRKSKAAPKKDPK